MANTRTRKASEMDTCFTPRQQIENRVYRIKNFVDNFDAATQMISSIKPRLSALQECWNKYNEILDKSEEDQNDRQALEEIYFELVVTMETLIESSKSTSSHDTFKPLGPVNSTSAVKLPIINLGFFHGDYAEWLSFRDMFQSLIHDNTSICNVEKFYYLKSCLKGDAANVIASLEVSAGAYQTAWDLLRNRFDNNRLIVNQHVRSLFNLTKIDKPNGSSLRTLLECTSANIRALGSLKQPVEHWDTLLVYIVTSKLDVITLRDWENSLTTDVCPTWQALHDFLTHRCQVAESVETAHTTAVLPYSKGYRNYIPPLTYKKNESSKVKQEKRETVCFSSRQTNYPDDLCMACNKDNHPIYLCPDFKKLTVEARFDKVKAMNVCTNCLRKGHYQRQCRSSGCKKCGKYHNTLLHVTRKVERPDTTEQNMSSKNPQSNSLASTSLNNFSNVRAKSCLVLLSTVIIDVRDKTGKLVPVRALLDSGSQSNFITESLAQRLGIRRQNISLDILGIDQSGTKAKTAIDAQLSSRTENYQARLTFVVLRRIANDYPVKPIQISLEGIPSSVRLADEQFYRPGRIDLLLGAEIFYEALDSGKFPLKNNSLVLQQTKFGWIVTGTVPSSSTQSIGNTRCHVSISNPESPSLDRMLERFWTLEERFPSQNLSLDEQECEEHFKRTVRRDCSGRFIVELPVKEDLSRIGSTRDVALKRLRQVTKRLNRSPLIKARYLDFMNEYQTLGHMIAVPADHVDCSVTYHIPHHAVHKEQSSSTKLRVVFDASTKGSCGRSLNECLMAGPVVQDDLFSIITRFRRYKIALTADISKMYRQIYIDPSQYNLQRIFWWDENLEKEREFYLTTLTYGTVPASFISTRCLLKLADDEEKSFPLGSKILKHDFYMDDLISGCNSLEEAKRLNLEITAVLKSAGMSLRKWCSNSAEFLDKIPVTDREVSLDIQFDQEPIVKTLGLFWSHSIDYFVFHVSGVNTHAAVTKRTVLSDIAKLFDPLGLVAPCTVISKIFMQKLWQLELSWDQLLPKDLYDSWSEFRAQLCYLDSIKVPRRIIPEDNPHIIELHGFSDASERAYGACVYMRCVYVTGTISSRLIASKSRVAPLKLITIPRLELCGALLLAELFDKIRKSLDLDTNAYSLWTDSTIVLGWLNTRSHLKTYVANRVSQILCLTDVQRWQHVKSVDNPADCLSRGMSAPELESFDLWWAGPTWLSTLESGWPQTNFDFTSQDLPEIKSSLTVTACLSTTGDSSILPRYSKLHELLRVTALCMRFSRNCRPKNNKVVGPLGPVEIQAAHDRWIELVQHEAFDDEIKLLASGKGISPRSKLNQLNPFIDNAGLLRVGGRLSKSTCIPYGQMHPLLLPAKHPFVILIARSEHVRLLHAGPQSLLASLRRKYWPLRGRDLVKNAYRQCITCFKANPRSGNQLMGDLPQHRVEPIRPFLRTGVDFCGPFFIRSGQSRNCKVVKCYVSVFVCFCTKAIHLELASDLTTEAFLAVLRRFIGRRGCPRTIYSDNATNFIGARNQLRELYLLFRSEQHKNALSRFGSNDYRIEWKTIPPRSPHFGALWESSVKLLKFHLKRIVGNASLRFEEFNTVLIQVEACLNSRPLSPMSDNPDDLNPITPGHFLVGEALTTVCEPDLQQCNLGTLSRWQMVQRISQNFWTRWSREYLSTLQPRAKWRTSSPNVKVGSLVILKEDNLPPSKWQLGRIAELHTGDDGLVRVATCRTAAGFVKRSITKICQFPDTRSPLEDKI